MTLQQILEKVKKGQLSVEHAEDLLKKEGYEEMDYAKLDAVGLGIICKSAGHFHIRLCTRNSSYTFCHPFLAFFGCKDKLTILFCKIQILGIFIYNISPVTGG